jgi:hypothetical protein
MRFAWRDGLLTMPCTAGRLSEFWLDPTMVVVKHGVYHCHLSGNQHSAASWYQYYSPGCFQPQCLKAWNTLETFINCAQEESIDSKCAQTANMHPLVQHS